MIRLVAPSEQHSGSLASMDAQLASFSEQFHAELHSLAGGQASPYIVALARAALQASGGTLALVAAAVAKPSAEANRLASLATELLDAARAAAEWEGVVRGKRPVRSKNLSQVPTHSDFTPRGGSMLEPLRSKPTTLRELITSVLKRDEASAFLRLLDGVEAAELAKPKPGRVVLRRVEGARRRIQNRIAALEQRTMHLRAWRW